MRIRRMYLNGFGIHRDRTFEVDTDAPATLFYGRNEAGKSTLMGFVRSMLFGFPTRSNMVERYEPVSGGTHGGALTLSDDQGREIRLERYEKNGSLKLTFADGSEGGEAALQSLIGGLTPDLYRNLFAFSLSELQRLETLHSEEISGFLFSAGMGVSGSAIVQAERKLAQQMEQLYKPRGSRQEINERLRNIEQSDADLRRSKENSGKFNEWQGELRQLEQRIAADEQELARIRGEWEWYNKCMQARESWVSLLEVDRELADLPVIDHFPEDALSRLETIQQEQERVTVQLEEIRQKRTSLLLQLEGMQVNERVIDRKVELEQLLESAVAYSEGKTRAADLAGELDSARDQLNRHLRQISAEWTEEQLRQFPLSVNHREQVNEYAERFVALHNRRQAYRSEAERVERQAEQVGNLLQERQRRLDELQQQQKSKFTRLLSAGHEGMDSFEQAIRNLWDALQRQTAQLVHVLERVDDARRSEELLQQGSRTGVPDQRDPASESRRAVVLSAGLLLNAGLPAWMWFGLKLQAESIVALVVIALINAFVWSSWSKPSIVKSSGGSLEALRKDMAARREGLQKEAEQIRRQWIEYRERLYALLGDGQSGFMESAPAMESDRSFTAMDFKDSLRRLEPVIESLQTDIVHWRQTEAELLQAEGQLQDTEQAMAEWQKQRAAADEHEQRLEQEEALLKQDWQEWLQRYRLPTDLSAESVKIMFQYAEQGLQAADRMSKAKLRLAALEEEHREFQQEAIDFLKLAGHGATVPASNVVYELKKLKETLDEHIRLKETRRHMEQSVSELDREERVCKETELRITGKFAELLAEAGASEVTELRKYARIAESRIELEQNKRHLEVVIFTWVMEENQTRLYETLEQTDADQLGQRLRSLDATAKSMERDLNEWKDRRGRLRNEIDSLKSGGEHAGLLQRHQENIADFQQLASRWAELSLSAELLRRAREIYERERQPGVLLRASQYIRTITDGRFIRVVSRLGEKSILVERDNGELLDSSFLSRGTAEQLYLSMRFALADEYSKTVALPLIMDDIFVNFDRDRLERTLTVLSEVANGHQILLFTCHDHVAEAMQAALAQLQLVDLHS